MRAVLVCDMMPRDARKDRRFPAPILQQHAGYFDNVARGHDGVLGRGQDVVHAVPQFVNMVRTSKSLSRVGSVP